MKTIVAASLFVVSSVLSQAVAAEARFAVVLSHGDLAKMADFASSAEKAENVWAAFEGEVVERLAADFAKMVPGGALELSFLDIDRAGDVNTIRNKGNPQVRYVEAIYIPRATFDYVVKDAAGAVLASGQAKIKDLGFQSRMGIASGAKTFFYETEMLRSWLNGDLAKALAPKPAK